MLFRIFAGFIATTLVTPAIAHAQTPAEYKDLEEMATKLFEAYNKDDAKGVFADYFSALQGQNADVLYKALFEPAKQKYGTYKSHSFVKEGSVKTDDIALLILNGQFTKSKAKVNVNFGKENNKWKIQQVTFSDE
jgi:hypothetical protein